MRESTSLQSAALASVWRKTPSSLPTERAQKEQPTVQPRDNSNTSGRWDMKPAAYGMSRAQRLICRSRQPAKRGSQTSIRRLLRLTLANLSSTKLRYQVKVSGSSPASSGNSRKSTSDAARGSTSSPVLANAASGSLRYAS